MIFNDFHNCKMNKFSEFFSIQKTNIPIQKKILRILKWTFFLEIIWTPKLINNFSNGKINFCLIFEIVKFGNSVIFQNEQYRLFDHFSN